MFQACTVESRFCVFVWWSSGQRLLRCVLCAAACFALVAQLALLERGFPCSSLVSSISVCVVRTCPLRTALDATLRNGSRHTKSLLLSSQHNSFHHTWKRSWACCFDPYCLTEELWLIWPYGGGIWKHVGEWETSRAQRKLD